MLLAYLKRIIAVAMLSSIAIVAYADDAPVYEVDNYPPPFDEQPADAGGGVETRGLDNIPPPRATYIPPPPQPLSMDQRVARVEQQVNNLQQSGSLNRADELQKEVQTLRGQVEELTHQLLQSQNQQRAMYADLDKRLANLPTTKPIVALSDTNEAVSKQLKSTPAPTLSKTAPQNNTIKQQPVTTTTVAPTAVKAANNNQPNVAEEQQIYQTAYDLIKSKKYNEAIAALQKMLQKYPTGQFAANAHYWLGELYGLLNKNEQSASEFGTVVKNYPDSPKVSDAQLKLGLIYAGQFKWVEAKAAFKKVINQYPGTASARLATDQLKQIKQSGH